MKKCKNKCQIYVQYDTLLYENQPSSLLLLFVDVFYCFFFVLFLMWTQVGTTKRQLGTRYKFQDILKSQDTEKSDGVS